LNVVSTAASTSPLAGQPVTHFIQAGQHRVRYVEGGEGVGSDGRPRPRAIILHGWIASHQLYRKCWAGFGEFLHYRAVDLVGFGDSDKPSPKEAAYDPRWYGEQVKALVDAMGWDKFILIAQSMGGVAATEFAIEHPERVEKLILIDSVGVAQPPPLLGKILQLPGIGGVLFQLLGGTRKSLRDFLVNDVWHVKSVFEESVLVDMLRIINSPGGKDAAYATLMKMTSPQAVQKFTPRFKELKVPTRLIWGEHDKLFPVEACGRTIQQLIPGATLDVIEGSGHEPPVEAPEQFLKVLKRLVQT
jgi:pimeloyl-ACP methyl ester carboxylesterase